MKKAILIIALLFLLIFEGVALELLPNNLLNLSVIATPHWILVFLITLSFLYEEIDPQDFIPYAIIFGLLVDIVYTDTLGVYMFAYGLALFTVILLKRILQENIIMTIFTTIISLILAEAIISGIYTVIGITDVYWIDNLTLRLLPTIIANIIFLLIIYPINKLILERLKNI